MIGNDPSFGEPPGAVHSAGRAVWAILIGTDPVLAAGRAVFAAVIANDQGVGGSAGW